MPHYNTFLALLTTILKPAIRHYINGLTVEIRMQVTLRLSDEHHAAVVQAATKQDIPVTVWIKLAIQDKLAALPKAPQAKPRTFSPTIEQKIRAGLAYLRTDSFPCRFDGQTFETAEAFMQAYPHLHVVTIYGHDDWRARRRSADEETGARARSELAQTLAKLPWDPS
jgi:hypothetical protein